MNIIYEAKITELIVALAFLLAIPLNLGGIIRLFRRSKSQKEEIERQSKKIDVLASIVEKQELIAEKLNGQIIELSNQTAQFRYQSELLNKSNNLLLTQIEVQKEALGHQKEIDQRKLAIQKERRLLEIKPQLELNGGKGGNWRKFTYGLLNVGAIMENLEMKVIENNGLTFNNISSQKVENGERKELTISNHSSTIPPTPFPKIKIEFTYNDIDGNKYIQLFERLDGRNHGAGISRPEILIIE